jgi:putative SOS response-associated peptidase YedK
MCGRFNVVQHPMMRFLQEITGQDFSVETSLNVAPTEQTPVLVKADSSWDLRHMRWWLIPYWSKEPTTKYAMFNAKSETLEKSSAFREPFRRRRCILPVSGYYEWKTESGVKVPYYIEPESDDGFALAALWDRWRGNNTVIESCTIVTAAAPQSMAAIHNRIPVYLTCDQVSSWVNPNADRKALAELLVPEICMPLKVTPMSTFVNNSRNKDERCLEALGEAVVIR